jgi:hypothetical protein
MVTPRMIAVTVGTHLRATYSSMDILTRLRPSDWLLLTEVGSEVAEDFPSPTSVGETASECVVLDFWAFMRAPAWRSEPD